MTTVQVHAVADGQPAADALAAAVAKAKQQHPLDPVTVIVPTNFAGLAARRMLGAQSGVANVAFVTPFRVAEMLAAGHIGDRRGLTSAVLAAAVRAELQAEPGWFAPVADHHATEAALVETYSRLSNALPETLDAIEAGSHRGAEVVRLQKAVRQRLAYYHDEADLAGVAHDRVRTAPTSASVQALGHVIWYRPERLTPPMARLLQALLTPAPAATVIVALTGSDHADAPVLAACAQAGIEVPAPPADTCGIPTGTRIISVSDPDEEARAVVREIAALAESGTRLDRIGVFWPTPTPYAATVHQQLESAGIPHNGPSQRRLADGVAGRTLLAALALASDGWGRAAVMALVAGGPIRHDGHVVSATRWERLSRKAGIVAGRDAWSTKLTDFAASTRQRGQVREAAGDLSDAALAAIERDATEAESLCAFVNSLGELVDEITTSAGWSAKGAAAQQLITALLGPEHRRMSSPDAERDAAERVDDALSRLNLLDELDPNPTPHLFEQVVATELDASTGRIGRFGEGVICSSLAMAAGLDLDAVFVLGMAEGTCPAPRRDHPLLPDEDCRRAAAGELVDRAGRQHDQHRAFLAALAAGRYHRVLLHPRGDLRSRRTRLPSRWLLDTASALSSTTVHSSDFARLEEPVVREIASFTHGLASATTHASPAERDLAVLLEHHTAGADPVTHPLGTGDLGRGLHATRARRSPAFTEWDGNLSGQPVPSPASGLPLSASGLQTWATCGYRYFLSYALGLSARNDPETVTSIDAAERGTLFHRILERFIDEAINRPGGAPGPTEAWTEADRTRLTEIAEEEFLTWEAQGLTGRALLWAVEKELLLADLDELLAVDAHHRAARGVSPVSTELSFGPTEVPVQLEISGGRVVHFRGKADRVDAGNGRHVVLDYKTGKGRGYDDLDDDPVQAGKTLQLGLYSEAARAAFGATDIESYYWMATSAGQFRLRGYAWTDDRRARFLSVLEAIVDGIGGGIFPARPGPYDSFFRSHKECGFCDFNRLCPRDRDDHERAKADAPELAVLGRLTLPAPEEDE